MCQPYGSGSEVWRERLIRRSRRTYQCYECDREIPRHSHYIDVFSVCDGSPASFSVHQACSNLNDFVREKICEANGERGFIPLGDLDGEIKSLDEYDKVIPKDDAGDLILMGFEVIDGDTCDPLTVETLPGAEFPMAHPGSIAAWLFELIRDHYPEFKQST